MTKFGKHNLVTLLMKISILAVVYWNFLVSTILCIGGLMLIAFTTIGAGTRDWARLRHGSRLQQGPEQHQERQEGQSLHRHWRHHGLRQCGEQVVQLQHSRLSDLHN